MYKITVVIPVYNCDKYLRRAIDSVLKQGSNEYELILINDGSVDNSLNICLEYSKNDNVKVIDIKNSGVSNARNLGIKKASGEYIIFLDADDYFNENYFKKINKILKEADFDIIINNYFNEYSKKCEKVIATKKDKYYDLKQEKNIILNLINNATINNLGNKVYKLDYIKKYNLYFDENIDFGEDLLFNLKYINKCENVYLSSFYNYNYVQYNTKSISKQNIDNRYEKLFYINSHILEISHVNPKRKKEVYNKIRIKNIYSCLINYLFFNKEVVLEDKLKYIEKIRKKEGKIILLKSNLPYFFLSLNYSYLSSHLLYFIILIMYKIRYINLLDWQH